MRVYHENLEDIVVKLSDYVLSLDSLLYEEDKNLLKLTFYERVIIDSSELSFLGRVLGKFTNGVSMRCPDTGEIANGKVRATTLSLRNVTKYHLEDDAKIGFYGLQKLATNSEGILEFIFDEPLSLIVFVRNLEGKLVGDIS